MRALVLMLVLLGAEALAQGSVRPVGPGGRIDLGSASTVYLNTDGNTVKIANGQEVGLSPGATVALDGATQFALTGGVCTVFNRAWQSIGTTATIVPSGSPTPGRTGIMITNRDGIREMACTCDGSTPTFGPPGLGEWLSEHGGYMKCPVNDSIAVACVASSAGGSNNLVATEEICAQGSPLAPRRQPSARLPPRAPWWLLGRRARS